MHEEEVDFLDIVDKEGLMARGHHMASLLVGAETNLNRITLSAIDTIPPRSSLLLLPYGLKIHRHTDGITI